MTELLAFAEKMVDKVGPLVAVLIGIISVGFYAMFRLGRWGKPLAEMVALKHVEFLNTSISTQAKLEATINDHDKRKFEKLEAIHADVKQIHGAVVPK